MAISPVQQLAVQQIATTLVAETGALSVAPWKPAASPPRTGFDPATLPLRPGIHAERIPMQAQAVMEDPAPLGGILLTSSTLFIFPRQGTEIEHLANIVVKSVTEVRNAQPDALPCHLVLDVTHWDNNSQDLDTLKTPLQKLIDRHAVTLDLRWCDTEGIQQYEFKQALTTTTAKGTALARVSSRDLKHLVKFPLYLPFVPFDLVSLLKGQKTRLRMWLSTQRERARLQKISTRELKELIQSSNFIEMTEAINLLDARAGTGDKEAASILATMEVRALVNQLEEMITNPPLDQATIIRRYFFPKTMVILYKLIHYHGNWHAYNAAHESEESDWKEKAPRLKFITGYYLMNLRMGTDLSRNHPLMKSLSNHPAAKTILPKYLRKLGGKESRVRQVASDSTFPDWARVEAIRVLLKDDIDPSEWNMDSNLRELLRYGSPDVQVSISSMLTDRPADETLMPLVKQSIQDMITRKAILPAHLYRDMSEPPDRALQAMRDNYNLSVLRRTYLDNPEDEIIEVEDHSKSDIPSLHFTSWVNAKTGLIEAVGPRSPEGGELVAVRWIMQEKREKTPDDQPKTVMRITAFSIDQETEKSNKTEEPNEIGPINFTQFIGQSVAVIEN